jgi:hypothetical protein
MQILNTFSLNGNYMYHLFQQSLTVNFANTVYL